MKVIAEQGSVEYYLHAAQIEIGVGNIKKAIQLLALAEIYGETL